MPAIIRIPFEGDEIEAVIDGDGTAWASVRSICKPIGLQYMGECTEMIELRGITTWDLTVTDNGKEFELFCIALDSLSAWLRELHPFVVRDATVKKLRTYQQACTEGLYKSLVRIAKFDTSPRADIATAFDRCLAVRLAPLIDRLAAIEARLGIENTTKEGE